MSATADNYDHGNDLWKGAGVSLWNGPRLSDRQCRVIRAELCLETSRQYSVPRWERWLRDRGGRRKKAKVRPVWMRQGITRVVHDVSHELSETLWPEARPHDPRHAALERHLIAFAIRRRFHLLVAPTKPKAPRAEVVKLRVERRATQAHANLKRAETRLKRAQTLVKKWRAKVRYYSGKPAA